MSAYKVSSILKCLPSAADGISVTTPAVSFGWSPWVEMTPAAPANMRLCGINALPGTRAFGNPYEVEIGVGSPGNEVTVAADRGYSGNQAGSICDWIDYLPMSVPADVISAGQRISCRIRQNIASISTWKVSLNYWERPVTGTMGVTTVGSTNVPSGTFLVVTAGAGYSYGPTVEITGATDAAWLIGKIMSIANNHQSWELQFGIGPAGSEDWKWAFLSVSHWFNFSNAWQGGPWNAILRPPIGPIPAGVRLAVRARSHQGAVVVTAGLVVTKENLVNVGSLQPRNVGDPVGVVTAAGGITVFSGWATLLPASGMDRVFVGVVKDYPQGGLAGYTRSQFALNISGTRTFFAEQYTNAGIWGGGRFNFALPAGRLIPAGAAIDVRLSTQQAGGGLTHYFAADTYDVSGSPDFANYSSDLIQQTYRNASDQPIFMFTGAAAWGNGAWVVIDDNVPINLVLTALEFEQQVGTIEAEVDFGLGTPGVVNSEVPFATLRWSSGANNGSMNYEILPMPQVLAAGGRFSMRVRCSVAGVQTFRFVPHYTQEPAATPAPVLVLLAYDCLTGVFTLVGTNLDTANAELTLVERDGTPVSFTVLTQTDTQITFTLIDPFVDGNYCVQVSNDDGDSNILCADVSCPFGCIISNSFGTL